MDFEYETIEGPSLQIVKRIASDPRTDVNVISNKVIIPSVMILLIQKVNILSPRFEGWKYSFAPRTN